jgi:hypothetical protein
MDGGSTARAGVAAPDALARAHQALLAQKDLQFDFNVVKVPDPPGWLKAFGDFLIAAAPVFKVIFWAGLAIGAAAILYFIAREALGLRLPAWKRRTPKPAVVDLEWRPSVERARTLIEDADRLAAHGRFDDAVHLLLFRSIEDIDARWPGQVRPALTSRDIAGLGQVPYAARLTFSGIARVVERSFFGGLSLGAADFATCRAAYEAFALPGAA